MAELERNIIGILPGKKKKLTEEELKEQRRRYNEKTKQIYGLKKKGGK